MRGEEETQKRLNSTLVMEPGNTEMLGGGMRAGSRTSDLEIITVFLARYFCTEGNPKL